MSTNQAIYGVATMCRVLAVSASGYYAWRQRPLSVRARADVELTARIRAIHQYSHETYGGPRIHHELRAAEIRVGCKRVARLMKAASLRGASRRQWVTPTVKTLITAAPHRPPKRGNSGRRLAKEREHLQPQPPR